MRSTMCLSPEKLNLTRIMPAVRYASVLLLLAFVIEVSAIAVPSVDNGTSSSDLRDPDSAACE